MIGSLSTKRFYIIYTFYSSLRLCSRKNNSNVNVSFPRFKNQGCHTVHMHLVVWFQKLGTINLDRIRASLPDDYKKLAYLVRVRYHFLHLSKNISQKIIIIFMLYHQIWHLSIFNTFQLSHLHYFVFLTFYQKLS